jgi:hypothetical protein
LNPFLLHGSNRLHRTTHFKSLKVLDNLSELQLREEQLQTS